MQYALVFVGLVLATQVSAKDLIVHQRSTTGAPDAPPREETVYVAGDKVVTDSAASRTIVDLATRTITAADKARRTYTVVTFDELRAQMEMLRKNIDAMPPEVRKLMGDMLQEGPPVTVRATGKTETIAGYPAKEYALSGGAYTGTVWATDAIETPPELAKWRALDEEAGVAQGPGRRLAQALATVKGFPLRTRITTKAGTAELQVASEVLDLKEAPAPKDVLQVPDGFTRQTAKPEAQAP